MTTPTHRYDAALADEIERKWQAHWDAEGTYCQPNPGDPGFDASRPKYFCMDMFPYPSGAGLHVGHPEGYIATDIVSRARRMQGHNVLHPMGWDAFGLPAEQYAIQTGIHPSITTLEAMDNFRRQLRRFGFCFDWSREFATIDPDYYKWTQWIFLRIYNAWFDEEAGRARPIEELRAEAEAGRIGAGPDDAIVRPASAGRGWAELDADARKRFVDANRLAYVAEQTVNWCPQLGTALANEEVIDGRSERGRFPVYRKPLQQWLFRITAYADRLLADLDRVEWPTSTKTMQTDWIGRSEGAEIDFPLAGGDALRVYATRPDTIFGATFMVVAPEHPLVARSERPEVAEYAAAASRRSDVERQENKEKTGVATGLFATNPATGTEIPVWVADYVLMGYGHGAIMAVPGQDERDWAFAEAHGLPIVRTVTPPADFEGDAYPGEGPAQNSGFLDGLGVTEAKAATIDWLEREGHGRRKVNYRLRDWLFSRQRYWGEPFPIVWDDAGRHYAVEPSALPVVLPEMEEFKPVVSDDPAPMLAGAPEWIETTAGAAGVAELPPETPVRRETNTMPNWAGSCWYYLRYCDPKNAERFCSREAERYWMGEAGVDLYIGGSEHAVLHLLYARFWHKVLFDLGEVSTPEPFARLFHQGMITGHAYQRDDRTLVPVDEVHENDGRFVETATGAEVTQIVAKMSKSLKNVINPDDVIEKYGADTFRLYEMYMGPLEDSMPWDTRAITGLYRFLQRAWRVAVDEETGELRPAAAPDTNAEVEKKLHRTIAKVGADIDKLAFNTAIAAMIELVNTANAPGMTEDQLDRFVRILAPFAPHFAEELWHRLGREGSVTQAAWPTYDEAMLKDDEIEIPIQILGKVRSKLTVSPDADNATLEKAALADARIQSLLDGKTVRKVIVVPGRLVNIVAN